MSLLLLWFYDCQIQIAIITALVPVNFKTQQKLIKSQTNKCRLVRHFCYMLHLLTTPIIELSQSCLLLNQSINQSK